MLGALILECVLLPGQRGPQHRVHPQGRFPSPPVWQLNHGKQDLCQQPNFMVYVSLLQLICSHFGSLIPCGELMIRLRSQRTKAVMDLTATSEMANAEIRCMLPAGFVH